MITNTISGKTTPSPRKIRGDARLAQLNPEQRELLRVWLEDENRPYSTVVSYLHQSFGLHTSKSAVAMYYQRHILPERHEDHNEGAAVFAALSSGEFDAVTITHAKALAWDALARPSPQIDTAAKFLNLAHRAEKQELARERLALEKQRVALRAQELASRPPRAPRTSNSGLQSPSPIRHARPTPPPAPIPAPTTRPSPLNAPAQDQTPIPSQPGSLTVDSSSTPPASIPASPEIPPAPPLFPASSSISQLPPSAASSAKADAPIGPSQSTSVPNPNPPSTVAPIVNPPPLPTPKPAPPRHTPWPHPDNPGRIRWP